LYVTYTTSKSRLLIEKKNNTIFHSFNLKNIRFLVEGATILLAFEGTDSSRNSTSHVLEASTLINLGSRGAKYENDKYQSRI
jgi:hypothetical protein